MRRGESTGKTLDDDCALTAGNSNGATSPKGRYVATGHRQQALHEVETMSLSQELPDSWTRAYEGKRS